MTYKEIKCLFKLIKNSDPNLAKMENCCIECRVKTRQTFHFNVFQRLILVQQDYVEIDKKHEMPGAGGLGPASCVLVRSGLLIPSREAAFSYFGRKHICSA